MAFRPLVSLVAKNVSEVKSLAVIEGLILVPLSAFLIHFILGLTAIEPMYKSMIAMAIGIGLAGMYARYASS